MQRKGQRLVQFRGLFDCTEGAIYCLSRIALQPQGPREGGTRPNPVTRSEKDGVGPLGATGSCRSAVSSSARASLSCPVK